MIKPREWQRRALDTFVEHTELCFLLNATPASGKTIFSGFCAKELIKQGVVDFCLIVVPTTAIKGDRDAGFLGDWHKVGLEITATLKDGKGRPREFNGGVITYQQLPNIIGTIETWHRRGTKLFVLFDEIHHATSDNRWGTLAERLARCSEKILAMTGTPFRSDGRRISFVNYDTNDKAIPDYSYGYRQAVAEKICKSVEFITDDGVADFVRAEEEASIRISKSEDNGLSVIERERLAADTARTIFRGNSPWLRKFIEKADIKLDEYRSWHPNAGGLVICPPGIDDKDDRYLKQIAKLVAEVTGEDPEIVSHDDKGSNARIERFRRSSARWMCAVRKVSEGVDIKRFRVLVMAHRPGTELLFRQLVGRVQRVDANSPRGNALVYLAKFIQLSEWAGRIRLEAEAGLKDQEKVEQRELQERENRQSDFIPLDSTHEDGGAISDAGDRFSADEINAADRVKFEHPEISDLPTTKVAKLAQIWGVRPEPTSPPDEPLAIRKKQIREKIVKAHRKLAFRLNPDNPDYPGAWVKIRKTMGIKDLDDLMDNYSLDKMQQTLDFLRSLNGVRNATA